MPGSTHRRPIAPDSPEGLVRLDGLQQPEWLLDLRERTPARILCGPGQSALPTRSYLELRADQAAASDAVVSNVELLGSFSTEFISQWNLFQVNSRCRDRREYLLRPDLGRQFAVESIDMIRQRCPSGCDLQIVMGDGLSVAALTRQGPSLLQRLAELVTERNWRMGQPFVVCNCRVGIMNQIGDILAPTVVVLLIGERPGLATAESLSAYMAFRPRSGHNDSQRNLISNIHERGVLHAEAADRIMSLSHRMRLLQRSGVDVKLQSAISSQ